MRVVAFSALVLAAAAVGCGDSGAGGSAVAQTRLTITAWPQGREEGNARRSTLTCRPTGGTLPTRARACRQLAGLARPFAPVPQDAVCTQIYGGPQEALITGVHRGRRVWARFNRRDGCQISRWDRISALLPAASGLDR